MEVKVNPNLYRLKELLGLVVYKGVSDSNIKHGTAHESGASFSIHRIEGTNVKIEAAD